MFLGDPSVGMMGTGGWNISTATYASKSKDVSGQAPSPGAIFFKPDGTIMYVTEIGTDAVYQYTLTTSWDVSTASYASKTKNVTAQISNALGLFFRPDGSTMYVSDIGAPAAIYQYTLGTPWDVSTASYASKVADVSAQASQVDGIFFKPDGKTLYVINKVAAADDIVYQYTLGTAWDVSTASYASKSKNISTGTSATTSVGVFFKPDGSIMYVISSDASDLVYQFTVSTPWDVSTASYASKSKDVTAQSTDTRDMAFSSEGFDMYVVGGGTIYQYTVGA